jgi:hypothetical protein
MAKHPVLPITAGVPADNRPTVAPAAWCLDIETGDPDDVIMLIICSTHSAIRPRLKCVTVTPGSRSQVALVRWILKSVGLLEQVKVGATDWPHNAKKRALGGTFYECFGSLATADADCRRADVLLAECCDENTTIVTGGSVAQVFLQHLP